MQFARCSMAMTQANRYTHVSDGMLPHREARRCDVAFPRVGLWSRSTGRGFRFPLQMLSCGG